MKDQQLFTHKKKDVSLSDIFENIYENSTKKNRTIQQLITRLQPLIESISDATLVVPLIKEYLEVAVKNDDMLVKLAAIVQRLYAAETKAAGSGDAVSFSLTEAEKEELRQGLAEIKEIDQDMNTTLKEASTKLDDIKGT